MLSLHGQPTGTQLRVKVPKLTHATTWPHIPHLHLESRSSGRGHRLYEARDASIEVRKQNAHSSTRAGQSQEGEAEEIIFRFHTHLYFHGYFVAYSTIRHGDNRCIKVKSRSLTSQPRSAQCHPEDPVFGPNTHSATVPTNPALGPRDRHQAKCINCIIGDPL